MSGKPGNDRIPFVSKWPVLARPSVAGFARPVTLPINNQLFGNENGDVNGNFTAEMHPQFVYTAGQTLSLSSDDDSWVFINNQLVLDQGGVHPSTLTADTGVYHEDTRILLLRGHVHGVNAADQRFVTDRAVVDTKTGTVEGSQPLAAQSSQGAIQSRSYSVDNKSKTVVFKGGVHAQLKSH